MTAAIYLKNGTVCKTNNIEKKQKKENRTFDILESWEFDNDLNKVDERFKHWCSVMKEKSQTQQTEDEIKKFYFHNEKTGHTITSIYPDLNNLSGLIDLSEWKATQSP